MEKKRAKIQPSIEVKLETGLVPERDLEGRRESETGAVSVGSKGDIGKKDEKALRRGGCGIAARNTTSQIGVWRSNRNRENHTH